MRTTKRRWLIAGAIGAPAVAATLWFAWLPGRIAQGVEERGRARGWDVSVEGVWPGLLAVELEGVRASRPGADVAVDSVELDAGPLELAFSGTDSVEEVRVHGGTVAIGAELFAAGGGSPGAAARGPSRAVVLDGVTVELVDSHGILARAAVDGQVGGDAVVVDGSDCTLGEAPSHRATADRVHLEASRHPDLGWQIAALRVQGAELRIGAGRAVSDGGDGPDREDDASATSGAPATRERGLAFLADGSSPGNPPETGDQGSAEAEPAGTGRTGDARAVAGEATGLVPIDRIAEGAKLEAVGVSVVRGPDGESETVLDDLMARIERSADTFEIRARAEGSGGSLRANLRAKWGPPSLEGTFAVSNLPFDVLLPFLPALPWYRPGEARVSLDIALDVPSAAQVEVEGSASVVSLSFDHPRLAAEPIREIDFAMEGHATLHPLEGRVSFRDVELSSGRASASISGELASADGELSSIDLHARLPPTECDDAISAIPRDVLAEAAGFSWRGSLAGSLDLEVDRANLGETELEVAIRDGCQFDTVPAVADLRRVRATFIHRVQEPDGSVFEMATGPGTAAWTPLARTSPYIVHAIVGHEDAGFFGHEGFAVYAIRDALERNLREGRYVVGASTISMQLAKNLFLHREKTLARKVQEVLLTWWLESALSKAEILELYFNIIEYGPGVYGITHAAEHYFGRAPAELSPAEAVYLASVLPNPKGLQASFEQGGLTTAMRGRMTRFLNHLHDRGRLDAAARDHGLAELDTFRFHREGEVSPSRRLPAGAAPLPVATASSAEVTEDDLSFDGEDSWVDEWAPMAPGDDEPGGG